MISEDSHRHVRVHACCCLVDVMRCNMAEDQPSVDDLKHVFHTLYKMCWLYDGRVERFL